MLAIIAGRGLLPATICAIRPDALICSMEGFEASIPDRSVDITFRVERLVPFFMELGNRGVTEVCFAGAVYRPTLDPSLFDPQTAALAPRFLQAMQNGDDATLRFVIDLFEEFDFGVRAAHEIAPDLLPLPGVLGAVEPDKIAQDDAIRATDVMRILSAADIGQGCVVQQGQVLAVEALPGTDWMLTSLADASFDGRPNPDRGSGIFFKSPKAGQDSRIDLPTIGPDTVRLVAAAGLGGVVIDAGGVMVLSLSQVISDCDAAGLFLWVRDPN